MSLNNYLYVFDEYGIGTETHLSFYEDKSKTVRFYENLRNQNIRRNSIEHQNKSCNKLKTKNKCRIK